MHLSLFTMIMMLLVECIPSVSTNNDLSGYHRVKLRAHRRRHGRKHADHTEIDELYEMLHEDKLRVNSRKAKNTMSKRERNEELCKSERVTVELNTDRDEYEPPFMEHLKCQNQADLDRGTTPQLAKQTCVHGMLRCVQQYSERHVSRRERGSTHWHPHTLSDVPTGCECMWPVEVFGHQEL